MSFLSLFTTTASAEQTPAAGGVAAAVRQGADRSGVSFDFLLRAAKRESALDPTAEASTSSATGLFQFIEQTWLATVKADGSKHGLQRYAEAITTGRNGRLTVADPALRTEILNLRKDPQTSAALAGELTRRNGAALASALGRQPSDGELYLAHVMGSGGASDLITRAQASPNATAARYFPDEAAANRGIFYARNGAARTLAEVRERLTAGFSGDGATVATAAAETASAGGAWLSFFPQASNIGDSQPFGGLFRTDGARAPISPAVAQLWSPAEGSQLNSFFAAGHADAISAAELARTGAVNQTAGRSRAPGKPLDLLAMMKPAAA